MEDRQYKILLDAVRKQDKRIDALEAVMNDFKKDVGDDRIKIDNVVLEQGKINGNLTILRGDINNLSKENTNNIKDAMQEVLEPAVKSVDNLTKEIKKREIVKIFKNGFIDFLKHKIKGGEQNVK